MTIATPVELLPRLRDWPERLDALLRARADWPFVWGVHDCCTFCADAVSRSRRNNRIMLAYSGCKGSVQRRMSSRRSWLGRCCHAW